MLKDMKTQTHLKPGQKGTKRLVEKFGYGSLYKALVPYIRNKFLI